MADYDLHCPFCGTQTVDGICPACAQGPERIAPQGVSSSRDTAHVDVPTSDRHAGSVDRLAIYTPEGARPGRFARGATLIAASISVTVFLALVVMLVAGLIATLFASATTSNSWLSVLFLMIGALLIVMLAICGTGLSIIWKHRGDSETARNASAGSPSTRD